MKGQVSRLNTRCQPVMGSYTPKMLFAASLDFAFQAKFALSILKNRMLFAKVMRQSNNHAEMERKSVCKDRARA